MAAESCSGLYLWKKRLLEALRGGLNAIVLMLIWLAPAIRIYLRTLNTIARPPTQLLDSNFTFVDVLDQEFSLQYQQFRFWPVVSAWLECQFRDCPGSLRINRELFSIFEDVQSTESAVMIPPDEWEVSICPGKRVLMSMYVGEHQAGREDWASQQACPSCSQPGQRARQTWEKW